MAQPIGGYASLISILYLEIVYEGVNTPRHGICPT